ncbi:hypothetical protein QW131_13720 [Roseibium salinum]|nr:hypothetical protein [Roseibium salinum]
MLLTSLALSSLARALRAAVVAALAATCGGLMVWVFANEAPETTRAVLLHVPGISEASFATVRQLLRNGLFDGMLLGAFSGVPYKIFAAEASFSGTSPLTFALLSPAVRLPRFVAMSVAAWGLSRLVGERPTAAQKLGISLALWAVFYVYYFSVVGW